MTLPPQALGLAMAFFAFGFDQSSKAWLFIFLDGREGPIPLTSVLNLVMVWNTGISFGMMNELGSGIAWVLVGLTLAIVAVLAAWLMKSKDNLQAGALGLVIGGALGNALDRVRFGAVADFFDFYVGDFHWPAFNLADSAIVIGVGLLLLHSMLPGSRKR